MKDDFDSVTTAPTAADSSFILQPSSFAIRLLIVVSVAVMAGRIAAARSAGGRPFAGVNDKSRWDTVRALVEHGTYAVDDVVDEAGSDTVQHRGTDGQLHLYSSKPPLLATIVAGEYWYLYHVAGLSLEAHPFLVSGIVLITFNVVPLAIYFVLLARLVERYGRTDWGRLYVMAAAAFGTFATTFATVLNNHVPAAVTAMGALYAAVRIWQGHRFASEPANGDDTASGRHSKYFAIAGLCAALTVVDELPALAFLVGLGALLFWKAPRETLIAFVLAASVVAVAFFATNYLAHGSFRPPYMHRGEQGPDDDWYHFTYVRKSDGQTVESYWNNPGKIDEGEPSVIWYAFNVLVGHHGILSLTPVWLLAVPGVYWMAKRGGQESRLTPFDRSTGSRLTAGGPTPVPSASSGQAVGERASHGTLKRELQLLAWLIGGVTIVVVGFYLFFVRQSDRNYGGVTCGFRWVIWLAPLWLLAALPSADWLAETKRRRLGGYILLAISIFSASYAVWSPWISPWLAEVFSFMGWENL